MTVQAAPSSLGVGSKVSWGAAWSGASRAQIALGAVGTAGDTLENKKNNNKVLWGKKFMLKMDNVLALQQSKAAVRWGAKAGRATGTLQDRNIEKSKGVLKN